MGIQHNMPVRMVRKWFRNVAVLHEDKPLVETALKELKQVVLPYSPEVGIGPEGKAAINLSGMRRWYGKRFPVLPREICEAVKTGLNIACVACGAAPSSFVAEICAKAARPNGIKACSAGSEPEVLSPLPVSLLPGLTKNAQQKLKDYNLSSIGDVQALSYHFLESRLGEEGRLVYAMVRGLHYKKENRKKSPGLAAARTFRQDMNDVFKIRENIQYIVDELTFLLRQHRQHAGAITFVITFSDSKASQRTAAFAEPVSAFADILNAAYRLFDALYTRRVSVRRIALKAGRLAQDNGQVHLFETETEKKHERVGEAIDRVRSRMGFNTLLNGNLMEVARG
jgi:DNA polymerase-4